MQELGLRLVLEAPQHPVVQRLGVEEPDGGPAQQLGVVGRLPSQHRVRRPPQLRQQRTQRRVVDRLARAARAGRQARVREPDEVLEERAELVLGQGVRELEEHLGQQPRRKAGHRRRRRALRAARLVVAGRVGQHRRPREGRELLAALLRVVAAHRPKVGRLGRERAQDRPVQLRLRRRRRGDEPLLEDVRRELVGGHAVEELTGAVGLVDETAERDQEGMLTRLRRRLGQLRRQRLEHRRPPVAASVLGALGEHRAERGHAQALLDLVGHVALLRHAARGVQTLHEAANLHRAARFASAFSLPSPFAIRPVRRWRY